MPLFSAKGVFFGQTMRHRVVEGLLLLLSSVALAIASAAAKYHKSDEVYNQSGVTGEPPYCAERGRSLPGDCREALEGSNTAGDSTETLPQPDGLD